jgi:hypothetical protein
MAGFHAAFFVSAKDKPVVRACFAAMRLRARKFRVKVESHILENGATIALNGQTYALDILPGRRRRDLPTIGEATPSGRDAAARRRTANGLVEILNRFRPSTRANSAVLRSRLRSRKQALSA